MGGSEYAFGKGERPSYLIGAGADNIYNVGGNIQHTGQGRTMGLLI